MKTIKLSDAQKEVIRLMREGWELAISYGLYSGSWMQSNGIGNGGNSKDVRFNTASALIDKKLIADNGRSKKLSDKYFSLTELGKTIEI